jgi:hypothetical protein
MMKVLRQRLAMSAQISAIAASRGAALLDQPS